MKLLHIADLHLGKKLSGYSMLEDQKYVLNSIIDYMNKNNIKHILLAGDVYDVASPAGDVIEAFDEFLNNLKKNDIKAFIISGNHDSNERVGYASKLLNSNNIFINSDIKSAINPITVDGINFYLIPNISKVGLEAAFDEKFDSLAYGMANLIEKMNLDKNATNVALVHQLVLPSSGNLTLGGSEDPIIGTLSNIPATVFKDFDYVALGHIHKPQKVADNARYSGSPLAYHSDETKFEKSFTIVDIENKKVTITTEKVKPLHDSVVINDTFENIINNYPQYKDCYVYAVIKGDDVEDAMPKLKAVFPLALSIKYDRDDIKGADIASRIEEMEKISDEDLFARFFKEQTNKDLTDFQKELVSKLLKGEEE